MDISVDTDQNVSVDSNRNKKKKKCLTISEYNAIVDWIDSMINDDNNDFILNKFGWLAQKAIEKYSQLHENTVVSIVDTEVQRYVRSCHYKVFKNNSNTNSVRSAVTPNQSPSHNQQCNKQLVNSPKVYDRYKELAANSSMTSPLTTLANNLRMPAMLVAKAVLTDYLYEEMSDQQCLNDTTNSSILNDENTLYNHSSSSLKQNCSTSNSEILNIDSLFNVDSKLSKELDWLSNKLLSMQTVSTDDEILNESDNSSSSVLSTVTKSSNKTHTLATSTWLLRTDPQLAYQVFKCSVIDGFYGPCVEFIKSCTGQRFEQLLKQNMISVTTDSKLQTKEPNNGFIYAGEKECRLRGLDMTPDMVLSEPIAISLFNNDSTEYNEEYVATSYIGGNDGEIRILNWIESKALFGEPEHLQTTMKRQLFPYWNRYGPGAVIYWFGHILADDENDTDFRSSVSKEKSITEVSVEDVRRAKTSTEASNLNFWSKYCILMDGFPAPSKIIMHDHRNNKEK